MGWMSKVFRQRSQDWILHRLDPAQVHSKLQGSSGPQQIEAEKHYLLVRLLSMHVVDVRKGIRRFYGAVHSYASLPHFDGEGAAEFNTLVTPAQLRDVDADRIDRVVQVNQTLFGPVPYRGGALELEVGLFSIRSADLTAPFLGLLETLSKTAGVSYVTQALPFAQPLKAGIDLLTGAEDDTVLEIGFAAEHWQPATGVWVNMRATSTAIDVANLTVEGDDFQLRHKGKPVSEYPYMLIEVAADTQRAAFFEIPELRKTYNDLRTALRKGKADEVNDALAVFRRAALTSGDLLFEDASRLAERAAKEVDAVLVVPPGPRGFATKAHGRPELPPLDAIGLYD